MNINLNDEDDYLSYLNKIPETPPTPFPSILNENFWDKEIRDYQIERKSKLSKKGYSGKSKKKSSSKYYRRRGYIRRDGVRIKSTYVRYKE